MVAIAISRDSSRASLARASRCRTGFQGTESPAADVADGIAGYLANRDAGMFDIGVWGRGIRYTGYNLGFFDLHAGEVCCMGVVVERDIVNADEIFENFDVT